MWFMSDLADLAHMSLLVWFKDDMWWWVLADLINLVDVAQVWGIEKRR